MSLKVYIVIGYDSIEDIAISEEIKSVWFSKRKANLCKKKHDYIRVEEHEISDDKPLWIVR